MNDENTEIALKYAKECDFDNVSYVKNISVGDIFVAAVNTNSEESDTGLPLYIVVKDGAARFASFEETITFMAT